MTYSKNVTVTCRGRISKSHNCHMVLKIMKEKNDKIVFTNLDKLSAIIPSKLVSRYEVLLTTKCLSKSNFFYNITFCYFVALT